MQSDFKAVCRGAKSPMQRSQRGEYTDLIFMSLVTSLESCVLTGLISTNVQEVWCVKALPHSLAERRRTEKERKERKRTN